MHLTLSALLTLGLTATGTLAAPAALQPRDFTHKNFLLATLTFPPSPFTTALQALYNTTSLTLGYTNTHRTDPSQPGDWAHLEASNPTLNALIAAQVPGSLNLPATPWSGIVSVEDNYSNEPGRIYCYGSGNTITDPRFVALMKKAGYSGVGFGFETHYAVDAQGEFLRAPMGGFDGAGVLLTGKAGKGESYVAGYRWRVVRPDGSLVAQG